jgi:dihydroorotate dehydrogenase
MQLYSSKLIIGRVICKNLVWLSSQPHMYTVLRSVLFLFPTEAVHYFSMNVLRLICSVGFLRKIVVKCCAPKHVAETELFGIRFPNPVGLAAGFDKNAVYLTSLEALGFGFVEIGTVTPLPQAGNDKPRLFRLPKDKALINRMGFNNDGAQAIAKRLKEWRVGGSTFIVGGNIGKNKTTPNDEAWKDYEICFRALYDCVDYFVVNVSSPNTPGLRELQEKDSLRKILSHLQTINREGTHKPKPLLLKIAPDLTQSQVDDVIDLAMEIKLDGLVATNTTISREGLRTPSEKVKAIGAGGLSGAPVLQRSTELVKYIHEKTNGKMPVIASGGIFTGKDARDKFNAGGALVQVWTGFIYEGPMIVKHICKELK